MGTTPRLGRAGAPRLALALFTVGFAACLQLEEEEPSQEAEALRYTAWSVTASLDALHDELVLAQPEGTHDRTMSCAGGGTAKVTGSTSIDTATSTRTVDLAYVFTGCRPAPRSTDGQLSGDIGLEGTATKQGSASSLSVSYTYTATHLAMDGFVTAYGTRYRVNRACDVSVVKKTAGSEGTICGAEISW